MALFETAQLAHTIYANRSKIKKILAAVIVIFSTFIFILYLIIATAFAVIQGNGTISDGTPDSGIPFTEFQSFSYKTINGSKWYDYIHPYYFPTLGRLTQGVILDSSAKVGLKHIAWDIADRKDRDTEVKSFSDGTVLAVNDNILHNTTRRWKFCDTAPGGICWYEVTEKADVQIACGYEVWIQHPDSLESQYCHLASYPAVKVGDPISGGNTIAYQGATGWATGKHLHFALWRGGQPIDPSYAFTQTSLANW